MISNLDVSVDDPSCVEVGQALQQLRRVLPHHELAQRPKAVQRSGDRAFGSVLEEDVELGFSALGAQIPDGIVMTYGAIDSDPTTV